MSTLDNISHDDIYEKIMLILMANEGTVYSDSQMYDLVLKKLSAGMFIPYDFKYKFMIVFRQLMSKMDDIKVIKKNQTYYAVYNYSNTLSGKELADTIQGLRPDYKSFDITNSDIANYVIKNDIKSEFNYIDPENGNTIHHEVLISSNQNTVKTMIDTNKINYTVLNYNKETPIESIKDIKTTNLVLVDLNNKIISLNTKMLEMDTNIRLAYNRIQELELKTKKDYSFSHFIRENWYHLLLLTIISYIVLTFFN